MLNCQLLLCAQTNHGGMRIANKIRLNTSHPFPLSIRWERGNLGDSRFLIPQAQLISRDLQTGIENGIAAICSWSWLAIDHRASRCANNVVGRYAAMADR